MELPAEVHLQAPCPQCGGRLSLRSAGIDLPYFGPALLTTIRCESCSFRHAETILTREGQPVRYTLRVDRGEALEARVVRSHSGMIRIPEIGAALEPGPRSEAFVTNAEGVLLRFEDVVRGAAALGADPAAVGATRERLKGMRAAREPFTLVLEDPTGNSAILHPEASREVLGAAEAQRLPRGDFVIDLRGVDL